MSTIPSLGAIKKYTGEYVYAAVANKIDKYVCPDCNRDLILKKGDIRIHHFAHLKDDIPCTYYNRPSESQIHKDAKMLLKNILDNKRQIVFNRSCLNYESYCIDKKIDEYIIPEVSETSQILIEYRFDYNGLKIADVAYIDNNEIVCLFEIYNTHKTEEYKRPEPWFEINALDLINLVNENNPIIKIECIRKITCEKCILIKCNRCENSCEKFIMNTNKVSTKICKKCDIDIYDRIYLNISYSDKDEIKKYRGRFDPQYKKWYIENNNQHKAVILARWKVWKPL